MLLHFLVYAKVQVSLAIYREQTSERPVEIQALNANNPRSCAVTRLRDHRECMVMSALSGRSD